MRVCLCTLIYMYMYTRIHMHSYIYKCVGVHALCIAKRIHRHEPRRFMWVYADRAHTVCVYLHPQRIRVMRNADVSSIG